MMKNKIFFLKKESSGPKDNKGNHGLFRLNPLPNYGTMTARHPVAVANSAQGQCACSFDIAVVTRCQCQPSPHPWGFFLPSPVKGDTETNYTLPLMYCARQGAIIPSSSLYGVNKNADRSCRKLSLKQTDPHMRVRAIDALKTLLAELSTGSKGRMHRLWQSHPSECPLVARHRAWKWMKCTNIKSGVWPPGGILVSS